ncbi:MAG: peptide chain release factor N(5)-glutamine methyltransferase [Phycisphaeraceae bacterium]|nr:peptide chain release factor N(5)-glutamine methyltransferase [Phycisphaeraceae bacterium]MCW5762328.1 peptide chain release factor N(5)-glutamine methyltransferase [Phycisphaeraceae bacterium]
MSVAQSGPNSVWTTRRLLSWMNDTFTQRGVESPRLCAEMLLCHVIGCDRLRLYMDSDRPATPIERQSLRELVARALAHEPIQYLIGEAWFFGLPMHVDRRVLIPRPCTAIIVEQVIQHARGRPGFGGHEGDALLIADVCTGSGCIAVAIARHLQHARIMATDLSPSALEVARQNAERHAVADRIDTICGDLLEPLLNHPVAGNKASLGALVANPPYIPDSEWDDVAPHVRNHEPTTALRGGTEGLDFVAPIIAHAPPLLRPGGLLAIEIATRTADTVLRIAQNHPLLTSPQILRDDDGLPRTLVAWRNA